MSDEGPRDPHDPRDPWKNLPGFPGGDPFGPNGPFGAGGPFRDLDDLFKQLGIDPDEFNKIFQQMQRNLHDAFKNLGEDPSRGFVSGFNVRIGPDGKPHVSTFGNKPQVRADREGVGIEDPGREPLTDVIEDDGSVAVTMELPGVSKKDIDLRMTEEQLEVAVDNDLRKYHKRVRLPTKVDPATTKATYKNGILDVTVAKVDRGDEGVRIPVS